MLPSSRLHRFFDLSDLLQENDDEDLDQWLAQQDVTDFQAALQHIFSGKLLLDDTFVDGLAYCGSWAIREGKPAFLDAILAYDDTKSLPPTYFPKTSQVWLRAALQRGDSGTFHKLLQRAEKYDVKLDAETLFRHPSGYFSPSRGAYMLQDTRHARRDALWQAAFQSSVLQFTPDTQQSFLTFFASRHMVHPTLQLCETKGHGFTQDMKDSYALAYHQFLTGFQSSSYSKTFFQFLGRIPTSYKPYIHDVITKQHPEAARSAVVHGDVRLAKYLAEIYPWLAKELQTTPDFFLTAVCKALWCQKSDEEGLEFFYSQWTGDPAVLKAHCFEHIEPQSLHLPIPESFFRFFTLKDLLIHLFLRLEQGYTYGLYSRQWLTPKMLNVIRRFEEENASCAGWAAPVRVGGGPGL